MAWDSTGSRPICLCKVQRVAKGRYAGNERFHSIIGEMADNEFLVPSLRRVLIDRTRIAMTFYNPRKRALALQRELAADQHDQFIALIETGGGDAAVDLAVAH